MEVHRNNVSTCIAPQFMCARGNNFATSGETQLIVRLLPDAGKFGWPPSVDHYCLLRKIIAQQECLLKEAHLY